MDNNPQIQDLLDQIVKLRNDLEQLQGQFYKNNFTSHQDFTKSCNFSTVLKVPSYSSLPNGEVGHILEMAGVLYICVAAPGTWNVVGEQVAP